MPQRYSIETVLGRRLTRRVTSKLSIAVVLAILSFGSATVDAEIEETLPSALCRGIWVVPLELATTGGEPLQMVLDTGAVPTSIDPDSLSRALGRAVAPKTVHTVNDLRVGSLRLGRQRIVAYELDHLGRALGRHIDGILGFPAFREVLLTLDYAKGEIRISRGKLPRPDGRSVFRLARKKRPHMKVELGGRSFEVLLDSGSTGFVSLRPSDRPAWSVDPRPLRAAARFDRIELESLGRLAEDLVFGPVRIERPIAEVSSGSRKVGFEILGHLVLTFDQLRRRIRMEAVGGTTISAGPYTGLGAALEPREDGFEVIRVFENSTANDIGLRIGDRLIEVDGKPIYEHGCGLRRRLTGPESVVIGYRRDGVVFRARAEIGELIP